MKELFTFLLYSGSSLCILLIILLIKRTQQHFSNKILIGIIGCLLALFLTYAAYYINNSSFLFVILPIGTIIPMALGPLLLNYIKSIYNPKINSQKIVKELIPFFISILLFTVPKYLLTNSNNSLENKLVLMSFIIPFIGFVYFIYHLVLSFKLLKKYRKQVKENYSYSRGIDLKWLSIWIYGLISFVVIDFISGGILLVYPSLEVILFLNLTFLACLIWYIGYYSLHQTHVFLLQREPSVSDNNLEIEEIKTEQPPSAVNTSPELQKKLEELFKIQQIYKNQNLTLRETAIQLATTDKKLSNYLNTSLDTTFYEYVNSYRIEHFKENIRNKQFENLTLLAIAFDAGFNSKATFNRVFKQQEGITPLQFKKSIEKSLIASSESI